MTAEPDRSAISGLRLQRTFAAGVAVPLILLVTSYVFITVAVRPACLRHLGTLGVCDPLSGIDRAAIVGQLALAVTVIVVAMLARVRHRRSLSAIHLAVACSLIWAALMCLFAAQRL